MPKFEHRLFRISKNWPLEELSSLNDLSAHPSIIMLKMRIQSIGMFL